MSFFVYLIQSQVTGRFYIGQTQNIEERINRHNHGRSQFTKTESPWKLVYQEEYEMRSQAMKRERHLKSPQGWQELKKIKGQVSSRNVAQLPKASLPRRGPSDVTGSALVTK